MSMKGTRNVLVHRYPHVDDKIIYKILTTKLSDFDKFIDEIIKFIESHKT